MGCGTSHISNFQYTIPELKAEKKDKETIAYVNTHHPSIEENVKEFETKTAVESLQEGLKQYSHRECLGYRKLDKDNKLEDSFSFYSYSQVDSLSTFIAKNLKSRKLYVEKNFEDENDQDNWKIVGIFARNCVEWVLTDLACHKSNTTSATFYHTLGSESFDYIFEQTQVSTVFVNPENLTKLSEYYATYKFKSLKNIVVFDLTLQYNNKKEDIEVFTNNGIKIILFSELIKENKDDSEFNNIKLEQAQPNSVFTICYTSGTTNLPKGAKLTQKGLACQMACSEDSGMNFNQQDVLLSYLPLAHIMERVSIFTSLSKGAKIGFISGADIKKYLVEDVSILKPTILFAVPRILVGFHQKIMDSFSKLTGCKKSLVTSGLKTKRENFINNCEITNSYYDTLVFSKVRNTFGGRVRVIITGAAPLPKDIATDMKLLMSCPIVEAYGMTELHGGSVVSNIHDLSNRNAGGVIRNLRMKLVDVPELNYHSETKFEGESAPTGEVCFKGPCVFKGYFRDLENTKKTIDNDGWIHTGDVGKIDPSNKGITIIDRVKEIFKLSQGEYIAPAKLEGMYIKSSFVAQLCIYGNSLKSCIVAIISINKVNVKDFLIKNGVIEAKSIDDIGDEDLKKYLDNKALLNGVKESLSVIGKECKFNSLEIPSKFVLTTEEFSVNNELVTPSMKLVRKKIEKYFEKEIEKAYA